jgi:hypothetical protein
LVMFKFMEYGVFMVGSVLDSGVQGFQNGVRQVNQAATTIARAGTVEPEKASSLEEITTAAVELKSGELQAKASAAVIRSADEVLGTLVNIKA